MFTRTHRIAGAGLVAGLLLAGAGVAVAGHANTVVTADLDGRQEVRTDSRDKRLVGDPNGRGEAYAFGIDDDVFDDGTTVDNSGTLCYLLLVDGIAELEQAPGNGRVAHIHEGAAGENGPVVANLAWPQGGEAADCLTAGERNKFSPPDGQSVEDLIGDILEHPEGYYFNVHNTEYPGGAIRGQLSGR
jgi:hypothetical protein